MTSNIYHHKNSPITNTKRRYITRQPKKLYQIMDDTDSSISDSSSESSESTESSSSSSSSTESTLDCSTDFDTISELTEFSNDSLEFNIFNSQRTVPQGVVRSHTLRQLNPNVNPFEPVNSSRKRQCPTDNRCCDSKRLRPSSPQECSICFSTMGQRQRLHELRCAHLFHEQCLAPWLRWHDTCPNCRTTV